MKTLYILRGLPGSGKSILASELLQLPDSAHVEADMFFMQNGKYVFDTTYLSAAHTWCKDQCKMFMREERRNIIVSNTFTQGWEFEPYEDMATYYDYKVVFLVVENRHGNHSSHNVPQETLDKMRKRFWIKL